jgi:CubicO group peptidase (beta-lactamase class C family)
MIGSVARACGIALLSASLAGCAGSPSTGSALASVDPRRSRLESLARAHHDSGKFDGAVLVAERGRVIYEGAFGDAVREWKVPNTVDTRFRIASTTKQFTAALVLRLVEEGKLRLDAPVTTYLPGYPKPQGDRLTLHYLLSHSSGLPNFVARPDFYSGVGRLSHTPAQLMSLVDTMPLRFDPGARWDYSNTNYALLGMIVERVTGMAYADALRKWILEPLALRDTYYDDEEVVVPRRAQGYIRGDSSWARAPFVDPSMIYAAGNLRSTVRDLYAWDRALAAGTVFRDSAAARRMVSPQVDTGTPLGGYGYGVFVGEYTLAGRQTRVIQHGGTVPGFVAGFWRMPDDDRTVIVLDNGMHQSVPELVRQLAEALYAGAHATTADPKAGR